MYKPRKIAVSTALFGREDNPYVQYLPTFAWSLSLPTAFEDFDVVVHATENLFPVIRRAFNATGTDHFSENGRLKLFPLKEEGLNNLTAARRRFDYFCQTPEGQSYEALVLQDIDDMVPETHLQTMMEKLEHSGADIVAADLSVFRESVFDSHPYLSRVIRDGQAITFANILHKNCIGLGAAIIRPDVLRLGNYQRLSEFPDAMAAAPDWPIVLVAIAKGAKAVFTTDSYILYRQHGNLSGITRTDDEAIAKAVKIKTLCYADLTKQGLPAPYHAQAVKLADTFGAMSRRFFRDGAPTREFTEYAEQQRQRVTGPYGTKVLQFWEIAAPARQ